METLTARQGLNWIKTGWQLFARSPLTWIFAVITYWLIMALAGLIPYLGALLATLFIPAFAVSFMAISRDLDQRRKVDPGLIFAGFQRNLGVLVRLGGIYLATTLIILALTQFIDGGLLFNWMLVNQPPAESDLETSAIGNAILLAMVLYLPVLMAFWFAPVLVAWHDMSATKSLFYSFFACLRNWRAFAAYGFAWVLLGGLLPGTLGTALAIAISGGAPNPAVSQTLLFGFLLILVPTLFASFYASYRDIFATPTVTPLPESEDPPPLE